MIIGLTGGIAGGKSTITKLLRADGFYVIDADEVTAQLYQTNKTAVQIIQNLCADCVTNDCVDRARLAECLTHHPNLLPTLEAEIHPLILREIQKRIASLATEKRAIILSAPILFETKAHLMCDRVICLYASVRKRWARAKMRPGMTREKFELLRQRQLSDKQRIRRSDKAVSTHTSIQKTYQKVRRSICDCMDQK